ncbi:hypothetical protein GCM10027598_62580 [Amycolatopsis oliviviridis]|uniref:Uncharacterized protein n=1 Tax=Amycolatopsis oliviviridis TaxID=1471590 RepID=A0ABQ3M6L7_9PSEU|nr:hypothetical protein [Amycolatopsis oliviviridis]GHH32960.1 hypothetical protein GCM10017790_70870 [Amycolatopsis oliviviridis]
MTATLSQGATGRSLISPELFSRLVRRIVTDEKMDQALAERILDQALAFLSACAADADSRFAPSELVDIGWHTFLLHTKDYAAFCSRSAGRFLHHVPTDENDPDAKGEQARDTLARTVTAIRTAGFIVDPDLWPRSATGSCTGCHNGCHDDPPPTL